MLQPTGRRSSDEDGAAVEEDGRRHLDEEEDGWRRPDAVPGENGGVGLHPPPLRVGFQTVGKIGPGAIPTWIANPGKKPGKGREYGLPN